MPLRQLYPGPETMVGGEAEVDIVAVHGLNPRNKPGQEHAWDTWRTPAGPKGKLWLCDELPKVLPNARIFLYEYNSTVVYGKNRSTFVDKANALLEELRVERQGEPLRPLLLLGHSLGGLLIKQSLINAHNNEKYKDIKNATRGLAFFATPHRGGNPTLVAFGQIVATIALDLGIQQGDNILETLKDGGMFSDLMGEHWRHRLLEYPIVSFWGTLDKIVAKESAQFGLPGKHEHVVELQASHGSVCKFGTCQHDRDNLKLVQANIRDLYDSAIQNEQRQMMKSKSSEKATTLRRNLHKSLYRAAKDRNPQRAKDTCEWFITHVRFQAWRRDRKACGLLIVSADPGCGKSVLSKYLVDEILQSSSDLTTCYFFFKDDVQDQKSAAGALCCLLRQLFKQKPALLQESILMQYDEDGDKLLDSFTDLWDILVSVSKYPEVGQIVCILDALDECEEQDRDLLIKTLNNFYLENGSDTALKFLVTTRPYVSIERGFYDLRTKFPTVRLRGENQPESGKIASEIDLVVEARITKLCAKLQLIKSEEEFMRREVTQKPNRTYLWVYLIFEMLERCNGQIKEHISAIPATVDDAYEKILFRIPPKDRDKARKLLCMVIVAKRPLTLKEMAAAMAIDSSHTSYSKLGIEPEERLPTWVRELCGLFVSIIDNKIYLLHQTAAEFLMDRTQDGKLRSPLLEKPKPHSVWKYSLSPETSHLILGSACAKLLLFTDVARHVREYFEKNERITSESLDSLEGGHPLLAYSMEHWATHLGKVGSEEYLPFEDMLQLCRGSQSACLVQLPRKRGDNDRFYRHVKDLTPLVAASILGFAPVTRHLLEQGSIGANTRDPFFKWPPLSWAIVCGHQAVFDTFIEAEAHYRKRRHLLKRLFRMRYINFDARTENSKWEPAVRPCDELKYPATPLGWAVRCGKAHIVQKLLGTGRVTVTKEMLFEAVMNDREDILRALLDTNQVRVPCRVKNGRGLLNWALRHRAVRVATRLLEMVKFDVAKETQPWGHELSGLAYVARRGADELLQLLLKTEKVDVDFKNYYSLWQTPLSIAAGTGASECVRLLLATGKVEVDSRDLEDRTPLSYASQGGHEGVVQQLLATGKANPDARASSLYAETKTPLMFAAMNGHEQVVHRLLATGEVDVNSTDGRGKTPLTFAAEGGHEGIVRQLLATGKANANCKDSLGRTPLKYAAMNGHGGVVQQLRADTTLPRS